MHRHRITVLAALLGGACTAADASCGAAFCLVDTDWSAQGAWVESGVRIDLRHERIDLDQPRAGRGRIAFGSLPRHHDEIETRNRNWIASADWNLGARWGIAAALPYVDRDHRHVHNHHGERLLDAWSFRGVGDARVQARFVAAAATTAETARASAWGFTFGAKLPTGKRDAANGAGALAERSLQPGTGTTDALVGAFWHGAAPLDGWSWFARAHAQLPLAARDGFRPGRQWQLDGGVRYAPTPRLGLMLQANGIAKARDAGANAEPADSGQRMLFASPGISWNATRHLQAYAFLQLPLYQRVNGVQLTADWSAVAGLSLRF